VGQEWEPAWGRSTACRTERFNREGDQGASLHRQQVQQDVSAARLGRARRNGRSSPREVEVQPLPLANLSVARLVTEMRRWREALEEHLRRSRSASEVGTPAPQVNR
jgi:hypothetical protein